MVGGPPYSPGATPVDHFKGFFLGSKILVGLRLGGDAGCADDGGGLVEESCGTGVAVELMEMWQFITAIVVCVCACLFGWREM